jgi:hypothetical protein
MWQAALYWIRERESEENFWMTEPSTADFVLSIDATSYLKGSGICYSFDTYDFIKFAYEHTGWLRSPLTLEAAC